MWRPADDFISHPPHAESNAASSAARCKSRGGIAWHLQGGDGVTSCFGVLSPGQPSAWTSLPAGAEAGMPEPELGI